MELKGSKTEKNLLAAFAGETQASIKYIYYSAKAKEDGYEQYADFIREIAHNEKEHAEIWFKTLNNGMPETKQNLKDAISGEHYEWSEMYNEFAVTAREEGFNDIAFLFENVGAIEKEHEQKYRILLDTIEKDEVFKAADENTLWICRNCGHVHKGSTPPVNCPVCTKPQAYFQLKCEG